MKTSAATSITEADTKLYALMRRVADIIFTDYAESNTSVRGPKPWLEDRRKEEVNPYYNQTASGLYLELYYKQVSRLWTPWGQWGFGGSGSGSWERIYPELFPRLEATVHTEVETTMMGQFGPVYALHKVDEEPLPEPTLREREEYVPYEDVKEVWRALTTNYVESLRKKGEASALVAQGV